MKKLFLIVLISIFVINLNAQEKGKIRVGFDAGLGLPNSGFGINGNIDIRYNIMDNLNVGLKFNPGFSVKDVLVDEVAPSASLTTSLISSTLLTSDYYFNNGSSGFAPYLGGGLGLFNIMNLGMSVSGTDEMPTPPSDFTGIEPETKFGGMLRGGFEAGHFRLGLEYYLIPKSTLIDILTLTPNGTSRNSFLNLTLGFYFGGGKWKK